MIVDYTAPDTLDAALEALRSRPGARPLGGGHRLILDLKRGVRRVPLLVDLRNLQELRGVYSGPSGDLRIGSMTTITELVTNPVLRASHTFGVLADAAAAVPDTQLRNRATVGGAIIIGTDLAAALIALAAEAHVSSDRRPSRRLPVEDLLDPATPTAMEADEIITWVQVPDATSSGAFERLADPATRTSLTGVAVCAVFAPDGGISSCRVAVCGDNGPACRVSALERALLGDAYDSSTGYRGHLAGVLARRAGLRAQGRASSRGEGAAG